MGHHHEHADVSNIRTVFFLNLGFTVIEIVGGLYVNSVAILSDAIHDFGDSISLGISWYFQKLSHQGRTKTFSYGYKRFSVLSAIINTIVLLIGSIFILMETLPRLYQPQQPNASGMIVLSLLGVIVNGAAVWKTRKGKTVNEKVVSLHLLEDVLGWVAVLIGSILMMFVNAPIIDPLLSIGITVYILYNVFRNLNQSFKIILQSIPADVNHQEIEKKLLEISQVNAVHDMHTWSMDGAYHVMTVHLVLGQPSDLEHREKIKKAARQILKDQAIIHATIELELEGEDCGMEDC